jgi:predicted membrane protein
MDDRWERKRDRWERKRERWERRWNRRARPYHPGRHMFSGMIFVIIGVVFLLGNMGLVDVDRIVRFWPVILIALGAFRLVEAGDEYGESSGIFWIVIGGFFLLGTMGILRVAFRELWPVLLIGFGALMLWRSTLAKKENSSFGTTSAEGPKPTPDSGPTAGASEADDNAASSNSNFSATAILGGFERRISSQDFRGGEATAIMGGCKIDLRRASITAPHEPVIKVFALFGGIEIRVPDDWTVVSEVELILGGFDDKKAEPPKVESKRLIVRGSVIMGGIEIVN